MTNKYSKLTIRKKCFIKKAYKMDSLKCGW